MFEGIIFDVYQWEQEQFDGSKKTFEKLTRPDTAVIFPVLPDGSILLIEDTQPAQQTYLCPPMGRVEPSDQSPQEAAQRELLEETGYRATELRPLYEFEPHIKIDWLIYAYVGVGLEKSGEPQSDAGERITLHPVSFDVLLELAVQPDFDDPRFSKMVLEARLDPAKMTALRKAFAQG